MKLEGSFHLESEIRSKGIMADNLSSNRERGFTMVEILIVLAVLGVLLVVVVPNLAGRA